VSKICKVAVVGGGLIGMSWTSLFLARDLKVVVVDPRPEVQEDTQKFIQKAWPDLEALGLTSDAPVEPPEFVNTISALNGIDYVQECAPDRLEMKQKLIEDLEKVIENEIIIASSSSSLKPSDLQSKAQHPERILVAHPINPPHIVPMVELVPGQKTSELTMQEAASFYERLKRVVIRVKKEVTGHLANRLTSALYREAVYIVSEGIADVADIDKAITFGPGMRWALVGPHLTYHLGGGVGGYQHYLDHLGPTQEAGWKEHGTAELTEKLKAKLVTGIQNELENQDIDSLSQRRDSALVELIKLKKKYGF